MLYCLKMVKIYVKENQQLGYLILHINIHNISQKDFKDLNNKIFQFINEHIVSSIITKIDFLYFFVYKF